MVLLDSFLRIFGRLLELLLSDLLLTLFLRREPPLFETFFSVSSLLALDDLDEDWVLVLGFDFTGLAGGETKFSSVRLQ